MSPSVPASAPRVARATCPSIRSRGSDGTYPISTGYARPRTSTTGAGSSSPPSRTASRSAATVADVASTRRSGRNPDRASSNSANNRSASRCRS